jgi:hypothetical protein
MRSSNDPPRQKPVESPADRPADIQRPLWDPNYITPIARRERSQKETGNPAERQTGQHRIDREESYYRRGFPVAGHGEPQSLNDPSGGRRRQRGRSM